MAFGIPILACLWRVAFGFLPFEHNGDDDENDDPEQQVEKGFGHVWSYKWRDGIETRLLLLLLPGRPVELLLKAVPAIDVVVLQGGLIRGEGGQVLRETGFEHEGHRIVQLHGLKISV